ncbi:MAG TPA: hypothetical protein VFN57_08215 [Thermomicrobiaceae bacterium]|nr:hypothetical protein [Thermomicrobiaceae bacterium]
MGRGRATLACLLAAAVVLAGCGGSTSGSPTAAATTAAAASTTATTASTGTTVAVATVTPGATVASTAGATGTAIPPSVTPTSGVVPSATAQAGAPSPTYLDDRSDAAAVVRSYYNAINLKEYDRAYSYWESGTAASQLPPYAQFKQGYANTAHVDLTLGQITGGAGAGQRYFDVPVVLHAQTTGGASQVFAGCYTLHLGVPQIQTTPPFHPMAIQSATVKQAGSGATTAGLLAGACPANQGQPVTPTAAPAPGDIAAGRYLDDRSTAVDVVQSFYNAINRKEYARAYGYWEPNTPPSRLEPFPQFQKGYANTAAVQLTTGNVTGGVSAGQLYWSVPVTILARSTDGSVQQFAGCYQLHLAQPLIQDAPPYQPIAIQSANVQPVPTGQSAALQMAAACQQP